MRLKFVSILRSRAYMMKCYLVCAEILIY